MISADIVYNYLVQRSYRHVFAQTKAYRLIGTVALSAAHLEVCTTMESLRDLGTPGFLLLAATPSGGNNAVLELMEISL